ncbi:cytochrome P450 2C44-like isoform X2 [Phyllostomus hastatus]|uniref:cytochrome P450 2C44-like isoform X2 n=1 Tax=Phyllostomus hastatus TaxID=9423 RepID=UPI001E6839A5|nr:cytochrome P450 2C44-like isoform X2 [Phyllostomus hastatus]
MELLEIITPVLAICVICLVFLLGRKESHKGESLPLGPTPLPIIGNLRHLNLKNIPASLSKLAQEYGPVYTVYIGPRPTVVLHGYEAVKEALIDQGDTFLGRGPFPIISDIQNRHAQPFDPSSILSSAACNVICSILFKERFQYHDEKFLFLMDLLNTNFREINTLWIQIYNLWPKFIKHLPGKHRSFFKKVVAVKHFILQKVKEHQESLDHSNPQDYIDCFLTKMEQEKHNPMSDFHLENLAFCGSNLFVGGTETISSTLRYSILLLMKHPEVQAKVHEEIDRVIGRNQSPSMTDKTKMPYTEAVLHEIQRYSKLLPCSIPHAVIRDTKFRQYVIPKGTTVFPLLSSVLYDCKEFPNPEKFDPGHFLDENGGLRKTDHFVPFSLGKRICIGEGLARMELFLFLTTILQNFSLKPLVEPKELQTQPVVTGFLNTPPPFKLCFIPR